MTERVKAGVNRAVMASLLAVGLTACDKVPLLAPANSTINLSANTLVVPTNGTTGLTAFVTESSGTPVQNGTTVRFTTTLGTVTPAETQTTNGIAVAMFQAGTSSGVAEVHALSGGATGAAPATPTNVVKITIGAAAVKTVTLRANPSTIGSNGGTVELIAAVVGDLGNGLQGILVSFNADQGTLSTQAVTTDANGEARTLLTTVQKTTVTATAGIVTSSPATVVDVRAGPGITIACAPATGTGTNCAAVAASSSNNTATVVFTVTKGTASSNLRDVTLDFGDGTSQSLGTLAGGAATVSHTYDGPSGSSPKAYVATARATDVNNETTAASVNVNVTPRAPLTVDLTVALSPATGHPTTATFTATVTGGDAQSFVWTFGDGNTATTTTNKTTHVYSEGNNYTATVTVTTTDGRTAVGRVEFNVT